MYINPDPLNRFIENTEMRYDDLKRTYNGTPTMICDQREEIVRLYGVILLLAAEVKKLQEQNNG
jgi:hypothetical protein